MGLFNFLKKKPSNRAVLVQNESAQWQDYDYKGFSKEGYRKCAVVYSAISGIASRVASLDGGVYRKRRHGAPELLYDHPLLTLLNKPNKEQSRSEFLEMAVSHHKLSGNIYFFGVQDKSALSQLWTLRPDRVKVIPNKALGLPTLYEYGESQKIQYRADYVTGRHEVLIFPPFDGHCFCSITHYGGMHYEKGIQTNQKLL